MSTIKDKDYIRYEEMFHTYFSSLCLFAHKYIKDFDSCKEIVHKVFVTIWDNRATFDFEKPAKSYLYTSVYNRCMNHIRDQKKFISAEHIDSLDINTDFQVYNDTLQASELEASIWKAVNSLPEKCREVFILNRFEGKKYNEIANIIGISLKTVETHMTKALKTLREQLKDVMYILLFFMINKLW